MLLAATSLLLPVPASLVALTPAQDAQRVLFVGNSLTYVGDIPGLIERLARATGARPVDTTCACLPGISLADQLEGSLARDAIARGGWDAVVLQEESQVTFLGGDTGPALDTFTRLLDGRTDRTRTRRRRIHGGRNSGSDHRGSALPRRLVCGRHAF